MNNEFTNAELKKASEHLYYEYEMLKLTALMLSANMRFDENTELKSQSTIKYALLKSFITHARNLIEFLLSESDRDGTTVLAYKYFKSPDDWLCKRGSIPEWLKNVKKNANKRLSHITKERLNVPVHEKEWEFKRIYNKINDILEKKFIKIVNPSLLCEKWYNQRMTYTESQTTD